MKIPKTFAASCIFCKAPVPYGNWCMCEECVAKERAEGVRIRQNKTTLKVVYSDLSNNYKNFKFGRMSNE